MITDVTLSDAGFLGSFYSPQNNSDKAVIVFTGSDGGLKRAQYLAELFAERGIAALALAYFKCRGLNRILRLIPLEYIERAAHWLKNNIHAEEIALYGLSKGAEYALSAAARFPFIDSVVAVVPNYYVAECLGKGLSCAGNSSWSYQGKPLPYLHLSMNRGAFITNSIIEKQLSVKTFYVLSEKNGVPDEVIIPVEKSKARILLLSSEQDNMWPSKQAGEKIVERLKKNNYPYAYKHVSFEVASHILTPVPPGKEKLFGKIMLVERQYPKECSNSRAEAFTLAVDWINR
jgi:dienelactone hydrolase